MKHLIGLLFFFLLLNEGHVQAQEELPPLVVASASIFADMAAVVGGDMIRVASVVPIGGDPHIHEPTPDNVRLINSADLILVNGLTFEGWMKDLIANSGT
ncbi:MAG: zinc ABC transporter substrate-binding protein, partial [Spirosomaceae bacterium]|nr:zinc ABC transporter substrate-binding protein [Spirosomataceae bacterium]